MEIIRNDNSERDTKRDNGRHAGNTFVSPVSKSLRSPIEYRSVASTDADWPERSDFDHGAKQRIPSAAPIASLVVTSIKPALRDQHRVNIFLDGKFSFSLDLAQLADFKLKVGQKLSKEELDELISASNFGKLYTRTLEYVFSRPHSTKEVRDHLKRKQRTRQLQSRRYDEFKERLKTDESFRRQVNESRARAHQSKLNNQNPAYTIDEDGGYTFQDNEGPSYAINNENEYGARRSSRYPTKPAAPISDNDIDKVIDRLVEKGYLDDANFARYFVENRHVGKGISTKKLRLELKKKGVADYIIDQALAESPRDQKEEIAKMIEKKRRRGYDDQKLIQYLLRQGFDYEQVKSSVLSEMD